VGAYKRRNKMAKKPSKRREALLKKVDATKEYGVDEAMKILKELKSAKNKI
jgi:large subunit ribosomal protein L1